MAVLSLTRKRTMWISIQTKGCSFSSRMRRSIDTNVRRALWREHRLIESIALTIEPTTLRGEHAYRCLLRIWSHYLGAIVVRDIGHTVRTTIQRAVSVARNNLRRRLHKRLSKLRRSNRRRERRDDRYLRWRSTAVKTPPTGIRRWRNHLSARNRPWNAELN